MGLFVSFIPFDRLKDSFQIFVVIMIKCSSLLRWTRQHPLCFISYVLLWCTIPLEDYYYWDLFRTIKKAPLVPLCIVLQNNENLQAKIKYRISHGKKVKFPHFFTVHKMYSLKPNQQANPHQRKLVTYTGWFFCWELIFFASSIKGDIDSLIVYRALERQRYNNLKEFLAWFFLSSDNIYYKTEMYFLQTGCATSSNVSVSELYLVCLQFCSAWSFGGFYWLRNSIIFHLLSCY